MQGSWHQLRAYLLTGGIAALVETALFTLLLKLSGQPLVSSTLSFLLAAVLNYSLCSRFVFKRRWALKGLVKFLAAAPIGLIVNVAVCLVMLSEFNLVPPLAKASGIAIAFGVNFTVNRLWVFGHHPSASGGVARADAFAEKAGRENEGPPCTDYALRLDARS